GAELGVPGLVLWTSLIIGVIIGLGRLHRRLPKSWRKGDPEQRFLSLALLYVPVSMIGFAVASAFVSFAWIDIVYILAAYTAGLYVCVAQKRRERGGHLGVPAPSRRMRGGAHVPLAAPAPARRSSFRR